MVPAYLPEAREDFFSSHWDWWLTICVGTCPGGDLSLWGFGEDSEKEMVKCCRPLKVEVFRLEDPGLLERGGWKPAEVAPYRGNHGLAIPQGEHEKAR